MLLAKETSRQKPLPEILCHEDKTHRSAGDVIILNVHASRSKTAKTKQTLIKPKGERDESETTLRDLGTNVSATDRTRRQKLTRVET